MRILWLTNIPLPEANNISNIKPIPFGGWLDRTSRDLGCDDGIQLAIAFPDIDRANDVLRGKKISYYPFYPIHLNNMKNVMLELIVEKTRPDLVHIFGTEFAHSLAMINICKSKNIKFVVSIQGLVSIYAQHYMANLPHSIQRSFTIRDLVKRDNIKQQQKSFYQRGKTEIEAIQKSEHVIGRTTWDKACVTQMNSLVKYHFCNETLRDSFYENEWNLEKCERNSIFISQSAYPIKGLHILLRAMVLVVKQFPSSMLYISGHDIVNSKSIKEKMRLSSYGKYIKKLIISCNLQNHVKFTGILDEQAMCERYLRSNVFVCPSSIENSPNSLGEAMLLGVPCVASDVGGISDMLVHKEEGFTYPFDEEYMLAYYICEIFKDEDLARRISTNARRHAQITHCHIKNLSDLRKIYKLVLKGISNE